MAIAALGHDNRSTIWHDVLPQQDHGHILLLVWLAPGLLQWPLSIQAAVQASARIATCSIGNFAA